MHGSSALLSSSYNKTKAKAYKFCAKLIQTGVQYCSILYFTCIVTLDTPYQTIVFNTLPDNCIQHLTHYYNWNCFSSLLFFIAL